MKKYLLAAAILFLGIPICAGYYDIQQFSVQPDTTNVQNDWYYRGSFHIGHDSYTVLAASIPVNIILHSSGTIDTLLLNATSVYATNIYATIVGTATHATTAGYATDTGLLDSYDSTHFVDTTSLQGIDGYKVFNSSISVSSMTTADYAVIVSTGFVVKDDATNADFWVRDSSICFASNAYVGNLFNFNSHVYLNRNNSSQRYLDLVAQYDDGVHFAIDDGNNSANNNFIFCMIDYVNNDFDHETPSSNPTIYVHSNANPNDDNTQYLSFSHNQSSGVITTGKGGLRLEPANDYLNIEGKLLMGLDFSIVLSTRSSVALQSQTPVAIGETFMHATQPGICVATGTAAGAWGYIPVEGLPSD